MKKVFVFTMLLIALISAAVCSAADFSNEGLVLSVPDEYANLVTVEVAEHDAEGMLFSVSEKASIEAAFKQGYMFDGAGWLFAIGRVSEDEMHQMLCDDMSGREVFAKAADGTCYILYHPTDVRMVREDYSDQSGLEQWSMLSEWAATVPETFIAENEGLTAEKHSNTTLDIYLARMLYRDDVDYTVSTTEFGPVEPGKVNVAPYLKPLTEGVVYEYADIQEAPDGEYVVLNFADDDVRFDFFFADGMENYIRQIWFHGEDTAFFKAVFDDPELKATELMNEFYRDLVLAQSLGYSEDDLSGSWTEKIAGRCTITIEKNEADTYDISIHWANSAFSTSFWTMTAAPTGNGSEIRYEDAKKTVVTYTSETEKTEEVLYENGTGTFGLLSTYELVWQDETENAAENCVFVKID